MAFKEATDMCAGSAAIYGAPDLKKVMEFFNGKAITCCCPVLVRDTIFSISCATTTSKRMRFDIPTGISACTTIVGTIPATASFTFVDLTSTQAITNKNLNGATNTITGAVVLACNTQEIWIGAEAMYGCGITDFCNPAGFIQRVTTCDVVITAQAFDTTTSEKVEFQWTPPFNWDALNSVGNLIKKHLLIKDLIASAL